MGRVRASWVTGAGLGRAAGGPHDLVLALAHLYVSKSPTGCLRPSARPEGSFAKLTKRVLSKTLRCDSWVWES